MVGDHPVRAFQPVCDLVRQYVAQQLVGLRFEVVGLPHEVQHHEKDERGHRRDRGRSLESRPGQLVAWTHEPGEDLDGNEQDDVEDQPGHRPPIPECHDGPQDRGETPHRVRSRLSDAAQQQRHDHEHRQVGRDEKVKYPGPPGPAVSHSEKRAQEDEVQREKGGSGVRGSTREQDDGERRVGDEGDPERTHGDSLEAADLLRILFEVCEVQQPLHEGWQFPTATPSGGGLDRAHCLMDVRDLPELDPAA